MLRIPARSPTLRIPAKHAPLRLSAGSFRVRILATHVPGPLNIPANVVTYQGEPITHLGEYVTYG